MEAQEQISKDMVSRAVRGDNAARSCLYRQYAKAMFNICSRMAGEFYSAEDLLQDAFIRAFDHLSELKSPERFGGWLRQITVNECLRQLRNRTGFLSVSEDLDEIEDDEKEDPWYSSISMPMLNEAIRQLPDGCRQILNLFVFEDYSHQQIAKCLGISESTSKSQYHRARTLLKQKLSKYLEINGQL